MQIPLHCYRDGSAQRARCRFKSTRLRLRCYRINRRRTQEGPPCGAIQLVSVVGSALVDGGWGAHRRSCPGAQKPHEELTTDPSYSAVSSRRPSPSSSRWRYYPNVSEAPTYVPSPNQVSSCQRPAQIQWTEANLFSKLHLSSLPIQTLRANLWRWRLKDTRRSLQSTLQRRGATVTAENDSGLHI